MRVWLLWRQLLDSFVIPFFLGLMFRVLNVLRVIAAIICLNVVAGGSWALVRHVPSGTSWYNATFVLLLDAFLFLSVFCSQTVLKQGSIGRHCCFWRVSD